MGYFDGDDVLDENFTGFVGSGSEYIAGSPGSAKTIPANEVLAALAGKPLETVVNPEAAEKTSRRKPKIFRKVFAIGAVLVAGQQAVRSVQGESWNGWSYQAAEKVLPKIGVGEVFFKYNRPTPDCDATPHTLTPPDFNKAREIVSQGLYFENDMGVIDGHLDAIKNAKTIDEARAYAEGFLKDRGVRAYFYSSDTAVQRIDLGEDITASLLENPSDNWFVDDKIKKEAIANFILSMSQMPKAEFADWGDTALLVPDNSRPQGKDGHIVPPVVYDINSFAVSTSLSAFENGPNIGLLFHEFAHRDHVANCGIDALDDDPQFTEINANGDKRIPDAYVTDYARDASVAEDVAETWVDLMRSSILPASSPRSSGPLTKKQSILVDRYSKRTGLSSEEILAIAEAQRVYGSSRHPLKSIKENIAPYVDLEFEMTEEGWVKSVNPGPFGNIPSFCRMDEDEVIQECRIGITGATITALPEGVKPKEWANGLRDMLVEAEPNKCKDFGSNIGQGEYDPSYPQNSKATVYLDFSQC